MKVMKTMKTMTELLTSPHAWERELGAEILRKGHKTCNEKTWHIARRRYEKKNRLPSKSKP